MITSIRQRYGAAWLALLFLAAPAVQAALAPPTVSVETSATSVTVSWTAVGGATGYTLYYAPYPSQSPVGQMNMGNRTSFSQSLPTGSAYYVAVSAYDSRGSSEVSNIASFEIGSGGGSGGTKYTISGTVSGLNGTGLVLQNNGSDDLSVSGSSFTFTTPVANGASYSITALSHPDNQYCNVIDGSGTVNGANVSDVSIVCVEGLYNVVDTAQSQCYNSMTGSETACTGTGYDADYTTRAPSYTLIGDGSMVLDDVTGLIWTQNTDLDGDGVTTDADDKLSQSEAESYCGNLTLGGYDWRLPSIKELYSLILFSGRDPSNYTGTDTSTLTPFIDGTFAWAFGDQSADERIIDGQYATTTYYTSTTMGGNTTMFGVNFIDGRIKGYPVQGKEFYVQCVTGNPSYGENDFVDNGDGTVTDNATGLMWEQDDHASSNWDQAVATCEAATTGGHSDWRLPDVKQLQSIVDYTRSPDYTGSAALDPLFDATQITREDGALGWGWYWASTTHVDNDGDGSNGAYVAFGEALGYWGEQSLSLDDVHGAGAQRSNDKRNVSRDAQGSANMGYGSFYYHGPQGDVLRLDNKVRCVREEM